MSDSTVGPNGKLKDVSKMVWFNDVDDEHPIPSSSMTTPLHPFFTGATPPAAIIASAHLLPKTIASPTPSIHDGESDGDVDTGGTDLDHPDAVGGDTEAEDDAEHAYASTKAMGDVDCKGLTCCPKAE
ncbi:hypothetical protein BD769DRAFT_1669834 [Suillus cothurnatus]|nr:hypothetical protein BD769DRAFT_1669834 [Suillus cothurnatus]